MKLIFLIPTIFITHKFISYFYLYYIYFFFIILYLFILLPIPHILCHPYMTRYVIFYVWPLIRYHMLSMHTCMSFTDVCALMYPCAHAFFPYMRAGVYLYMYTCTFILLSHMCVFLLLFPHCHLHIVYYCSPCWAICLLPWFLMHHYWFFKLFNTWLPHPNASHRLPDVAWPIRMFFPLATTLHLVF